MVPQFRKIYNSYKMIKSILQCAFAVAIVSAVEFPKYFKPCSLSAPNINQCLVEQGNAAWAALIQGDATYHIPKLSPEFLLEDIAVNVTPHFQIYYTDIKIYNFDTLKLTAAEYDKTLNKFIFKLFSPNYNATSTYDMKLHQFMGEDIHGKGKFNISIVNSEYIVEVYLKTITKDGVEYYALERSSLDFTPERMYLEFQGLFDGDVVQGEFANGHINAHWTEYWKNVRTATNAVFDKLTKLLFNAYTSKIPKSQFFLP